MSKLLKLKQWLTVSEAAAHFSTSLDEPVSVADLYRLSLDGHLTLSAYFVNHTYGRLGKIVPIENASILTITPEHPLYKFGAGSRGKSDPGFEIPEQIVLGVALDDKNVLDFEERVVTIDGVWDLMMVGSEALDVEHLYQGLVNGPPVELESIDGAFVRRGDVICQLVESFDNNEYQKGSKASLDAMERHLRENKLSDDEEKKIRDQYQQDRKEYLKDRAEADCSNDYYPAGKLPDDALLVIRSEEIIRFLQSLSDPVMAHDKPLTTKERHTLLVLIAALCANSDIDYSQRGIASALALMTENIAAPLTDDTIRKILGQIDDALEARRR